MDQNKIPWNMACPFGIFMKHFLKSSTFFLLPCVIVAAVLVGGAFSVENGLYLKKIRLPPAVRFVAIGDSQSGCGIDPEVWPEAANQCATGLSLDQYLYKVRDVVQVNSGTGFTLLIDVNPRRLATQLDPLSTGDYESKYAVLNYRHVSRSRRSIGEPVKLFRDRLLKSAFHHSTGRRFKKKKNRENLDADKPWGGFARRNEARYVTDPADAKKDTEEYLSIVVDICSGEDPFSRNLGLLDEIVDVARSSGHDIVLVTTPWHKSLLEQFPPELAEQFVKTVGTFALERNVRWVNAWNWTDGDAGFLNQNHLNATGAAAFTAYLRELLSQEGAR